MFNFPFKMLLKRPNELKIGFLWWESGALPFYLARHFDVKSFRGK